MRVALDHGLNDMVNLEDTRVSLEEKEERKSERGTNMVGGVLVNLLSPVNDGAVLRGLGRLVAVLVQASKQRLVRVGVDVAL